MYTEGANIIDVPTNYVPFDCSGVSFQLPDGCEHAVAVRPFAKRVFFFSFRTGNNGHREVLIWPLGGGSCQLGCMHACVCRYGGGSLVPVRGRSSPHPPSTGHPHHRKRIVSTRHPSQLRVRRACDSIVCSVLVKLFRLSIKSRADIARFSSRDGSLTRRSSRK